MYKTFHDLETYSPVPIKNGTHAYAEQAEILLWAFSVTENDPIQVWDVASGETMPSDLWHLIHDPEAELWWHNGGMFDRIVLKHAEPDIYKQLPLARWRDTMVQALSHGLPGSLDKLGEIFNLPQDVAKSKEGKRYIQLFCKPLAKNSKLRRATAQTHPEEWKGFVEYAKQDIAAMRELHRLMPQWNYPNNAFELTLWQLDQRINEYGIPVDVEFARAAVQAIDTRQDSLSEEAQQITDGAVDRATQRDKMLAYLLEDYGIELKDMRKSTVEKAIANDDLPLTVRRLLSLRLEATATSTAKYKALLKTVSSDGRLRGTMQFNGAARTGRTAHRLFQPGNLPRLNVNLIRKEFNIPANEPIKTFHKKEYLELGRLALKRGMAEELFNNITGLASNTIRTCIATQPGKKLVVSDLSNIEGRVAALLANETWKLEAFKKYDEGKGPDLYKVAASRAFGLPIKDITDELRQIGKVQELALAYGGGCGAFATMVLTYGVKLAEIQAAVQRNLPSIGQTIYQVSVEFYEWAKKNRKTAGLSKEVFIACDILKRLWRNANPHIVSYWKQLEDSVRCAIAEEGKTIKCGPLFIRRNKSWLRIVLPSGRELCYPHPRIEEQGYISYMGVDPFSKKWKRINTYGGKLFENVTQAGARDVFFYALPSIENSGYMPILLVHDEVVTETDDDTVFNAPHLSHLLTTAFWVPKSLPLAAAGFEDQIYRKG